jgi:heme/copper-type cytochrome/quinol oxidase subunit 4
MPPAPSPTASNKKIIEIEEEHIWTTIPIDDDSNRKYSKPTVSSSLLFNNMTSLLKHWKGASDFAKAQCQVVVVLIIAYIGNNVSFFIIVHFSQPPKQHDDNKLTTIFSIIIIILVEVLVSS